MFSNKKKKKLKPKVLYAVDLDGREFDGPANLTFYDVIEENGYYMIRYYGCCAVHTSKTLKEAKKYISEKAAHILAKQKGKQEEAI